MKTITSVFTFVLFLSVFFTSISARAQNQPPATENNIVVSTQQNGSVSGTVVEADTKQPVSSASIQVFQDVLNPRTHQVRELLVSSMISNADGTFTLKNLPTPSKLRLLVVVIGRNNFQKIVNLTEDSTNVNLGNIEMTEASSNLKTVTVNATADQYFKMGVDRKIFSVDKSLVSTGQTAQEVMAQIPSVDVDIDGNVSLRGGSPQLFIDGRPTTLSLDQIPSDIIDKVELITNPSAKFDASSNGGSIINIVLKKNKTTGYNGGVTAGMDTRGAPQFGADFNLRQGKFNIFARGMYRGRNGSSTNYSDRDNLNDTSIVQRGNSLNKGSFSFYNAGIDYLMDDRNTLSLSGRYVIGDFDQRQPQTVDSLASGIPYSYSNLDSRSKFNFKDYGGELSFKHNFTEDGKHNLALDAEYRKSSNANNANLVTGVFRDPGHTYQLAPNILRTTIGDGGNTRFTFQADYVNPITEDSKIEAGVRVATRDNTSNSYQYDDSTGTAQDISGMKLNTRVSNRYSYNDKVYAAYGIFSSKFADNLSYQVGLRVESSSYSGKNYNIDGTAFTPFKVDYPVNLFPSAFLTYNITDKQDLQVNYSRKINRPNFFQLLPVYDYSDPYNISVGNPGLKPEFTNMFELSYDNNYGSGGNFLTSLYMRQTNDLITRYQYIDKTIDPNNDSTIINSYLNANNSYTYGLELTNKVTVFKIWDLTANVNFFNSIINSTTIDGDAVKNQRLSWFAKLNNNFKLPANISVQLSADYHAKTVLPNNSNDQRRGGFGFNNLGTAQGYIAPRYGVDAAIKKDWKWGSGNTLSLTASINDIFATNDYKTYSQTQFMIQNTSRLRNPQVVRFTLSYRFGKIDKSLFKRKVQPSADQDDDSSEMGM